MCEIRLFSINYCYVHNQGYCLEYTCKKSYEEISKSVCGVDICSGLHSYNHGKLLYNPSIGLYEFELTKDQSYYGEDWMIEDFKEEIYDSELNLFQ